jgi:hypothetical protein
MGGYTTAVSGQRLGKNFPAATNRRATVDVLLGKGVFLHGPCQGVIWTIGTTKCGGGVEYLRRSPASHRRRRKEVSNLRQ